jgi:hypothetical protein
MMSTIRRTHCIVALACASTTVMAFAQQTPARDAARVPIRGAASIAGTVVADDAAHTPIPHAVLTLAMAGAGGQRTTSTDEAGRYFFSELPAAVYTITAARGAYLTASYGALSEVAPPLPIPIKDGQRFVANPIVLVRGAVIAGRISDAEGRPLANARVTAMRVVTSNGERKPGNSALDRGYAQPTDSRGLYRIYGLPAGDYVVFANVFMNAQAIVPMTPADAQWADARQTQRGTAPAPPPQRAHPFISASTYFPSVADLASAGVVSLGRAEEKGGIDISVLRVGTARVTGVVYGVDGRVAPGAIVLNSRKRVTAFEISAGLGAQARSMADGSFTMNGVTPGDYTITARASAQGAPPAAAPGQPFGSSLPSGPLTLWGQADVTVSGDDIDGVAIHLQPGMTVSGSIVFEGNTPPPTDVSRFQPRLVATDNNMTTVTVDQGGGPVAKTDRTFTIDAVMPGAYVLTGNGAAPQTAGAAPSWMIKSIVAGTRDLLNAPFDVNPREDVSGVVVTYTDRHTELDGQLRDAAGQPVSDFRVFAFSTNRDRWVTKILPRWMASVRASVDGSFRIIGLPAGEYYVCAFVDGAQPPAPDEALLTTLVPASIKITLAEGETHTQTFKVGG